MVQTTSNNKLSTQIGKNKKNYNISSCIDGSTDRSVSRSIENLSTVTKLAKSKKLDFAKSKKSILLNDFVKVNSTKTDFLTPKAKKTFIHP